MDSKKGSWTYRKDEFLCLKFDSVNANEYNRI